MIFGGVPYYLSLLKNNLSLVENVDSLIFRIGGNLSDEFNELYNALFKKADRYIKIVKFLATKREGFTKTEIANSTGFSGGGLTKMLDNLERCDFIISYAQFGNKTKQTIYRLCDFFTLFYLRYANNNSKDEHYWQHHFQDRSVSSWEGFSFEELCLRHLPHIKHGLGISGIATEASSWRYLPQQKNNTERGAQVDLVISRADKIIHLCEMKFSSTYYAISKDYAERLTQRRLQFMEANRLSRGAVITFITPYGLQQGINTSLVHSSLTSSHLFAEILE